MVLSKIKTQKGAPAADRSAPAFRLIVQDATGADYGSGPPNRKSLEKRTDKDLSAGGALHVAAKFVAHPG